MSDFVTRLESELRRAALRQERAGWPRRVALPRLREFGGPAATAVAILGAALVVAAVATVFHRSEPERPAGGDVPAELPGTWRLPATVVERARGGHARRPAPLPGGGGGVRALHRARGAIEALLRDRQPLRRHARGGHLLGRRKSDHLPGPDSSPLPSGPLRRSRHYPGVYRWQVQNGSLYLTKLRDELSARPATLTSGPLTGQASRPKRRSRTGGRQTASDRNATATPSAIPATGPR